MRLPKPASSTPAKQCDLLAAAEVVSALHQLSIGYKQIVERVLIVRTWPEVHRTIRRHRPHVRTGKFWLANRLPDQWTANPAHKFPSSRPEGPSREAGTTAVTLAHILARSSLASTKPSDGNRAPSAPYPPAVTVDQAEPLIGPPLPAVTSTCSGSQMSRIWATVEPPQRSSSCPG